jgi:hypothetical protein
VTIEFTTPIKASSEVVSADLNGDLALLSLESGVYYNLNDTGACFWESLKSCKNMSDVLASMMETYDVDESVLRQDIKALADELLALGLIAIEE